MGTVRLKMLAPLQGLVSGLQVADPLAQQVSRRLRSGSGSRSSTYYTVSRCRPLSLLSVSRASSSVRSLRLEQQPVCLKMSWRPTLVK